MVVFASFHRDFCTTQVLQRKENVTTCDKVAKLQYEHPGWEIDKDLSGFKDMSDADIRNTLWTYSTSKDDSQICHLFK